MGPLENQKSCQKTYFSVGSSLHRLQYLPGACFTVGSRGPNFIQGASTCPGRRSCTGCRGTAAHHGLHHGLKAISAWVPGSTSCPSFLPNFGAFRAVSPIFFSLLSLTVVAQDILSSLTQMPAVSLMDNFGQWQIHFGAGENQFFLT